MSESPSAAPSTSRAGLTLDDAKQKGWPPNILAVFKRMSPAGRYLGLEILDVEMESLTVKVAFNASDDLCNLWGGIQGGMVAAMLDDVMAFAIGLDLDWGQISPTLEIKVSMLAPARPGRLYATGTVIKRGKSVGFVESELRDAEGRLLATGSSTATFVTLKKRE